MKGTAKLKGVARRVLFISYHYPPDSQIGAKRAARLAKFFMQNGWDVGVLTVQEKFYERVDRLYGIRGVDLHCTGMFRSVRLLIPRAKRQIGRLKRVVRCDEGRIPGKSEGLAVQEAPIPVSGASRDPVPWIKRFIISMIWLPDDRQGWVPFGLWRCLKLLPAYRLVYSTSPPWSTHLIPLFASYVSRKFIWVAEFRDPWTTFLRPPYMRTKLGDWLGEKWEASVMARSARVVVVTEAMKRDLADKYPAYADKIRVYSNGFDRDEFAPLADPAAKQETDKTTFVYAGQFDYGRNPLTFLNALSELIEERVLERARVRVLLMSNTEIDGASIEGMARRFRMEDVVQCLGYVPFDRCVKEMSRADVLLLFSIDQPLQVPAKLYEYLALNKRILSISTGGITTELIDRTGSGINVKPDDVPGMKEAILALVSGKGPQRNEREVAKFDIRAIASALSEDVAGLMERV